MLKEEELIGTISIYRQEVCPFTDKQIELVSNFATQAVIAIENTRLFEAEQARTRELTERTQELTEALEYQTATSEVLSVISQTQADVHRVFTAIMDCAVRLCHADLGAICRAENGQIIPIAFNPSTPEIWKVIREDYPRPIDTSSLVGRALVTGKTIHVPDLQDATAPTYATRVSQGLGFRSQLSVPILAGDQPIGVLALMRRRPGPYTPAQIALVTTFADQAVIAIENARLFEEVQARTRELTKTIEDLEIASQHKNQFVANMSHELRTPLAAILGYAELMQEGFYEPLGQKSLDALTRIRSNGKHLLGLINTVLDIAKIESGQFTLNMSEYAIESVVETVRAATESLAQNKKLTLTTSVHKPLPVGLGDEQRLTQVLLNLVGNAIKFTDAGEVSIAAGARNGHFAVSVTDTGPGIPLDQRGRIFDQFHQVDSSLTKAKGGTGLGLAIAKQIVEMHGGGIWVESTVGKGSTFQMEIPTRAEFRKRAL
jgi:signal transduction histidine kinase